MLSPLERGQRAPSLSDTDQNIPDVQSDVHRGYENGGDNPHHRPFIFLLKTMGVFATRASAPVLNVTSQNGTAKRGVNGGDRVPLGWGLYFGAASPVRCWGS
jgi:hypothetical protein